MHNLKNIGSEIEQIIEHLPIQTAEGAVAAIAGSQEQLLSLAPELTEVQQILGEAATKLAKAGSALAEAGTSLTDYLESLGFTPNETSDRVAVSAEPETKIPAARCGIKPPPDHRGIPQDIRQAMQSVYGLFRLPYDISADEIYDSLRSIRRHADGIKACLGREETVDWMLDALNSIGSKGLFEQTDDFDRIRSYQDLLNDGIVDECVGQLESMAQKADIPRLERIMRFSTEMRSTLRCSRRAREILDRHIHKLVAAGSDLTYMALFLTKKEHSTLMSKTLIPPSDLTDPAKARKIWAQKAALAKAMAKDFSYSWVRSNHALFKDALERLRVTAADLFDTEMLAEIISASHGYSSMREYLSNDGAIVNIMALGEIERRSPGACEQIYTRFGIRQFAKNDPDQLIAQNNFYDELLRRRKAGETTQHLAWAAAAVSLKDDPGDKGAFNERAEWFKKTQAQIEAAVGQKVPFCIFEFASPKEAAHSLGRMRWIAQQAGPAIFGVLHSHGKEDGFQSGLGRPRITMPYITEIFGRQLSRILGRGATLIMNSCTTGKPGGVAEHISRLSGRRVVAPKIPDNIAKMAFNNSPDGLGVDVEYCFGDTVGAVYDNPK